MAGAISSAGRTTQEASLSPFLQSRCDTCTSKELSSQELSGPRARAKPRDCRHSTGLSVGTYCCKVCLEDGSLREAIGCNFPIYRIGAYVNGACGFASLPDDEIFAKDDSPPPQCALRRKSRRISRLDTDLYCLEINRSMKRRRPEIGLHYGLPSRSWVSLANNFNRIKTRCACINLNSHNLH